MKRIGQAVASAVSTVLVLGVSGAVSAQTVQPSDPTPQHEGSSANPSKKEADQQQNFDKEKTALRDDVEASITAADQNVDALKKMSEADKGATKTRDDSLEKKVSTSRDQLKSDLTRIDGASADQWATVRPMVKAHLHAAHADLKQASAVTQVPVPKLGAANRQPAEPKSNTGAPTEKQPKQNQYQHQNQNQNPDQNMQNMPEQNR